MIGRFICVLLVSSCAASATRYILRTLDQRWPDVDIVAVVNVGEVHAVSTAAGMTLHSAEATIERSIFRRSDPIDPHDRRRIRIHLLFPNGPENGGLFLAPGRAFVMMKQNGLNAFFPADPWEFQPLSGDEISWPTKNGVKKRSICEVAREVKEHINGLTKEEKR